MRRNKIAIVLAALVLVAGVAWYFGSPAYAMSQLRDAAAEGNKEDLEERIDFPAVRESLKSQMRAMMADEMVNASEEDGFAAFGAVLGMAMIDPMIEGFVNPDSMAAMIRRGKMQRAQERAAEPQGEPTDWSIERDGVSRFEARPEVPAGQEAPTLVFERDGIDWKLVGIELPEGGLDPDAT